MSRSLHVLTTFLGALLLITAYPAPAFAQDEAKASDQAPKKVTMKGTLVCLGCDLKMAHSAASTATSTP